MVRMFMSMCVSFSIERYCVHLYTVSIERYCVHLYTVSIERYCVHLYTVPCVSYIIRAAPGMRVRRRQEHL